MNESIVRQYAAQLQDEVKPQVSEMLNLAEKGARQLQKKDTKLCGQVHVNAFIQFGSG